MRAIHHHSLFFIFLMVFISSYAQETIFWDVVQKIRVEAFERSEVMENASWLSDVFGPWNAKSPSYIAAANWAKERLEKYGLSNARLEPYEFGKGYVNEYVSVHMLQPQYMPIIAYPATWSAGTNGKVRGRVITINFDEIASEADLRQYRGKLENAIIFTRPKQEITPHFEPMVTRFTQDQLDAMARIPVGLRDREERRRRRVDETRLSKQKIVDFVMGEGAAVLVRTDGRNDFGTVAVENTRYTLETRPWEVDAPPHPPELVMAAEHYNRILRIMEKDIPVEMGVELRVSYTADQPYDYNVVAEIPGSDLKWMKPLKNLGMSHLFPSGFVHEAYEEVGLPAFTFVQDRMAERAYHSNMDTYDRLVAEDLMANSVILATFVYHAAMRDEKLPRFSSVPWEQEK